MYCTHCGSNMEDYPVCPQCGRPAENAFDRENDGREFPTRGGGPATDEACFTESRDVEEGSKGPVVAVRSFLAEAVGSPLLLTIAVLMLTSAALALVGAFVADIGWASFGVIVTILDGIAILLAVFGARERRGSYLGEGGGFLRGMLTAHYVIGWVGFGFICLLLLFLLVGGKMVLQLLEQGLGGFSLEDFGLMGLSYGYGGYGSHFDGMLHILYGVLIAVLAVVLVVMLLEILFFLRGLLHMGKDIHTSLQTGVFRVTHVRAVRGWGLAFAIGCFLVGVLTLGDNLLSGLASLCEAAAYFLLFLWTGRFFIPKEE